MKHAVLAALTIAALSGCGDRAKPNDTFAKASDPKVNGISADTTCSPLPEGVVLDFPYHLRSDYFQLNVLKMIRRRVVMQYMQIDMAQAEQSLRKSMLAAGFTVYDSRPGKDNQIHDRYHKKGYGMAHVFLKQNADTTDAIVKGTLTFDLPPPQFNPPRASRKPPPQKPTG
jgi:hypothetical protein